MVFKLVAHFLDKKKGTDNKYLVCKIMCPFSGDKGCLTDDEELIQFCMEEMRRHVNPLEVGDVLQIDNRYYFLKQNNKWHLTNSM
jgi:hypothetical protein